MLVDAGELVDGDVDPGFFTYLAAYTSFERLVQLEDAAGWLPLAVVAALNGQDALVLVDDDACDTDGVLGTHDSCEAVGA